MNAEQVYDNEVASLYRKHLRRVQGYLANMGTDPGLTEEIADDAFLAARLHWARVRMFDQPEAYVFKVARNERSKRQKTQDRQARELRPDPGADVPKPGAELGEKICEQLVLRQALQQLQPKVREAVILRYLADFSIEETAQIMEIRPGTVKRYTFEGRELLRVLIEDFYGPGGQGDA